MTSASEIPADLSVLARIRAHGFAVVPNVLDSFTVETMKRELLRSAKEDLAAWAGRDYPDAWMVHNLMVRNSVFARFLENAVLHSYLSPLLGDTCILYAYTSSSMPPAGANFSSRVHVDSPRVIPGYWTNVGVMVALDDFTSENGATRFLPGSFERVAAPSREEFAQSEEVFPTAGDAVVFNARTWHMGGRNTTGVARHAVTLNVCRSYMRQRFDYPRLVGGETLDHVGEVGRRFLGFNVRMPSTLEEYYLPDAERLYKAGQG
ncbi:MAG: phytanoyl-CoA dioxygenase family protein [Actinobacteria bacterium]|nr:phytanoyl-CoA dioxygenase family protein [Actinomycetota bacterium]